MQHRDTLLRLLGIGAERGDGLRFFVCGQHTTVLLTEFVHRRVSTYHRRNGGSESLPPFLRTNSSLPGLWDVVQVFGKRPVDRHLEEAAGLWVDDGGAVGGEEDSNLVL